MKRQYAIILLLMLTVLPIQVVSGQDLYIEGVYYKSRDDGGFIDFQQNFTATLMDNEDNIVYWLTLTTVNETNHVFGSFGVDAVAGINVTVSELTPSRVNLTIVKTGAGMKTLRFYCPTKGMPIVTGGEQFSWDGVNGKMYVYIDSSETISLSWAWYQEGDGTPSSSRTNLLTQFLIVGDLIGFTTSVYTQALGLSMFGMFLMLLASIPLYSRLGAWGVSIMWVLFWGMFNVFIPPRGINIASTLLALSLTSLIILVLFSRRSGYE